MTDLPLTIPRSIYPLFPPQVFLYKSIRFLASVVKESTKEDWETYITAPVSVLQELTFCLNSLPLWTGKSIEFISKVKSFDMDDLDHPNIKDIEIYAGDAGEKFKTCQLVLLISF